MKALLPAGAIFSLSRESDVGFVPARFARLAAAKTTSRPRKERPEATMADNNKPKFDLPWGTLLPLLAVLAGVIATYKPLVSERPSVPSEKTAPVIAAQDVDARLWQDPIGVAQKQKSQLNQQGDRPAKEASAKLHDICALAALLDQDVKAFSEIARPVLLLAVMLDAGPYSEQAESRLRARHAVLEGLSESGFMPIDGEHIGFVTATWPPPEAKVPSLPVKDALLLPWEECEAIDDRERVFPQTPSGLS